MLVRIRLCDGSRIIIPVSMLLDGIIAKKVINIEVKKEMSDPSRGGYYEQDTITEKQILFLRSGEGEDIELESVIEGNDGYSYDYMSSEIFRTIEDICRT